MAKILDAIPQLPSDCSIWSEDHWTSVWEFLKKPVRKECAYCEEFGATLDFCSDCQIHFLRVFSVVDHDNCEACDNCKSYGFPCLNCAESEFHGKLGRGHDVYEHRRQKTPPYSIRRLCEMLRNR